jgi:hypothetical protein
MPQSLELRASSQVFARVLLASLGVLALFAVYVSDGRFVESTDTFGAELLPISILEQHNLWFDQYYVDPTSDLTGAAAVRPGSIAPEVAYRVTPETSWEHTAWWFSVVNGHVLTYFPILAGLINTPAFAVAAWMGIDLRANVIALTHITAAAVAALSVLGMYLCLVQVSTRRTAVFLSVAFAFGTAVWSTNSRSLYQHGPSLLFLTSAIALLLTRRKRLVGLAGLFVGLAVFDRPSNAIAAAAIALYIVRTERKALRHFAALAAIPLALMLWYSMAAWGSPLAFGQGNPPGVLLQQGEPFEALVGLLLSPNRGLLVFSPILIFSLALVVHALRLSGRPALLPYLLGSSVVTYAVYCFWPDWSGGHTYGYRYLIDILPSLMLVIAISWERVVAPRAALRAAFVAALLASIYLQGLGATTAPCGFDDDPNDINYHHERLWDISNGEIARCAQMHADGIRGVLVSYG